MRETSPSGFIPGTVVHDEAHYARMTPRRPADMAGVAGMAPVGLRPYQRDFVDAYQHARAVADEAARLFKPPPAKAVKAARKVAVFGLTGNPPTRSHASSVKWLQAQGFTVPVVVSMGHETKDSLRTYPIRAKMCEMEWPDLVWRVEEELWPRVGLPVFTYDILTAARDRWTQIDGVAPEVFAAIGPDIDPRKWLGYPEIMKAGFDFQPLPQAEFRSTLVRDAVMSGAGVDKWGHMVSPQIADFILRHRLFTRDALRINRTDLSYLT